MSAGGGSLAGIKVLDLSSNLAGPLAAMVLGDLGADVIKVEHPERGDDTRNLPPTRDGEGTVFLSVNRNKRSAGIDVRDPAGRDAVLRLAATADVWIESFAPGVAERLGIGHEEVAARNPAIVYAAVSAFGRGPIGGARPGYDGLVQGFSGMLSITGHADGPPARVAPSSIDLSTGLWLVIGIQAALTEREATGRGGRLDVALLDTAFNLMGHQLLGMLATGETPGRLGTESPSSTPNGAYRSSDGWLVVATGNDRLFARLGGAIGLPRLAEEERFRTATARIAAREELHEILVERFARRTTAEWTRLLGEAGVPAGPLNDLAAALADPLTVERQLLVTPAGDRPAGESPQLRLPIDPDGSGVRTPPPELGRHTDQVLREAGFEEAEIEALRGRRPEEVDAAREAFDSDDDHSMLNKQVIVFEEGKPLTAAEAQYPLEPHLLDASTYVDPQQYEREIEQIFYRSWLPILPSSDVAEPREMAVWDMLEQSVIVTRLDDGSLSAWHNVCQHRGARLVRGSGRCEGGRIRCPWHGFAYDLEGRVVAAPLPESFPESEIDGLRAPRVEVDEWGGFVWISMSDEVPPLREYLGEIGQLMDGYGLDDFEFRYREPLRLKANWKLVMDAFNETWHVPFTHKDTLSGIVLWRDAVLHLEPPHSWMELPLRGYTERVGGDDPLKKQICHFLTFPNTIASCFPTHLQAWSAWPVSPKETLLQIWGLVGPTPDGMSDEEWAKRNDRDWEQFLAVAAEDSEVIDDFGTVVRSLGFKRNLFNTAESRLTAFHEEIHRRVGGPPVREARR